MITSAQEVCRPLPAYIGRLDVQNRHRRLSGAFPHKHLQKKLGKRLFIDLYLLTLLLAASKTLITEIYGNLNILKGVYIWITNSKNRRLVTDIR